ncbi:MAG: DUF4330 domain-containing protein [Oscillospiraceae bacterium]|nr:DUF4330 domain-containing protein [Oscillospiraceae bacterium]
MIDKDGKLFGKVNLIDFIIVLVLVALIAFAAVKFLGSRGEAAPLTEISISFYGEEVPEYVTEYLKEGTSVRDDNKDITIGSVTGFELGEPLGYATDAQGEVQQVIRNGYKSVVLHITAYGEMGEHGATVNGALYGVGHTLTLYAGQAKMYMKVCAIEPVS